MDPRNSVILVLMDIKKANFPNDLPLIRSVAENAFSTTSDSSLEQWFSFDEMQKIISENRGICLKAVDANDTIIGMIFAQQESPINGLESKEKWVIVIAAIITSMMAKGIGSNLLNSLEVEVRKFSAKKLFVYTNKDDERVIDFYKKNGYENAGWIRDYQYGIGNSAVFLLKYL